MGEKISVVCLRLDDGKVQPLAWTEGKLSIKQLRKACKQFRHSPDVVEPASMHWARLYKSLAEMKRELPKY